MFRSKLIVPVLLANSLVAQIAPMVAPVENPTTPEKVLLGKMLFWEEQLSGDDSMACGTCHQPENGGSDGRNRIGIHPGIDGLFNSADDIRGSHSLVRQDSNGNFTSASSFGFSEQATRRTAPSALGAGFRTTLNWDGSAGETFVDPETSTTLIAAGAALETQALLPILNPVEMGFEGRTWQDVRLKLSNVQPMKLASNLTPDIQAALQQYSDYPSLFAAAFGDPSISASRIAYALASYERTLNPDQTSWDLYMAGDPTAMTNLEIVGWDLIVNKGNCLSCHQAPLFADDNSYALGLRSVAEDPGSGNGAFRTPSLRNAGLRPRLFHNGASDRLGHPSQFWDGESTLNAHWLGGGPANTIGTTPSSLPNLSNQGVSQNEVALMLEFVRTALVDNRAKHRQPPFDHPDLRSMTEPRPRLFGDSLPGSIEPFLIDWVPPYPGNTEFKLGIVGSQPGSIAILTIGFQSYEPNIFVSGLPYSLAPLAILIFQLGGASDEPGNVTWHVPLPTDPIFATYPLYYQAYCTDPYAPNGIAASQGTEFFIR
jgi:cytochrome c peroxidase